MLRNLNRTLPTGRVLGTPWVGLPAAQIAADTATGDHGPGILYNEAVQPEFAGQRLRAEVQNWPPVGTLRVHEDGSFEIDGLPDGLHTFAYRVYADGVLAGETAFEVRVGAQDAEAPGAVLASAAALVAGGATGYSAASAPGVSMASSSAFSPGVAVGYRAATAPGATLASVSLLMPGVATAAVSAVASGATLSGSSDILPGMASAGSSVVANGAALFSVAQLQPGMATGLRAATASGVTITGGSALLPGMAQGGGSAVASGAFLSSEAILIPGMASASGGAQSATAPGATLGSSGASCAGMDEIMQALRIINRGVQRASLLVPHTENL